uniref:Uncharacterized protein n=1 Tax=Timema genevievae TaxID=629358 RepID=A0A7R9K4B4_TIMGE|nr:unnamed protein product [Timema genevievae]
MKRRTQFTLYTATTGQRDRHCSVVKLVTSRMQDCCFFLSFPKNLFYSMRRLSFLHSNLLIFSASTFCEMLLSSLATVLSLPRISIISATPGPSCDKERGKCITTGRSPRKYSKHTVNSQINRALSNQEPIMKQPSNDIPLTTEYYEGLNQLRFILNTGYNILTSPHLVQNLLNSAPRITVSTDQASNNIRPKLKYNYCVAEYNGLTTGTLRQRMVTVSIPTTPTVTNQ